MLEKSIDAAANQPPDETTRIPQSVPQLKPGELLIERPITVESVSGLGLHGLGTNCRIVPVVDMTHVLKINGMSKSAIGDFQIGGAHPDSKNVVVDVPLIVDGDRETAVRSTSKNRFTNISIGGFYFGKSGVHIGQSKNKQNDQTQWDNLIVQGFWRPNDEHDNEAGHELDDGRLTAVEAVTIGSEEGSGNVLNHNFDNLVVVGCARGVANYAVESWHRCNQVGRRARRRFLPTRKAYRRRIDSRVVAIRFRAGVIQTMRTRWALGGLERRRVIPM
jgi:hypothetical protein